MNNLPVNGPLHRRSPKAEARGSILRSQSYFTIVGTTNNQSVVRFPNPLAPDIQIHVSWGTRLVLCYFFKVKDHFVENDHESNNIIK